MDRVTAEENRFGINEPILDGIGMETIETSGNLVGVSTEVGQQFNAQKGVQELSSSSPPQQSSACAAAVSTLHTCSIPIILLTILIKSAPPLQHGTSDKIKI